MKVLAFLLALAFGLCTPAHRCVAAPAPRKLTNIENAYPSFSPDGAQTQFRSNRTGNWELFVGAADGSDQHQLTEHPSAAVTPSWSPDGKRIVFNREREGTTDICVVDVE